MGSQGKTSRDAACRGVSLEKAQVAAFVKAQLAQLLLVLRGIDADIREQESVKDQLGSILMDFARTPSAACRHQNIVLSGPAGSGKTTLAKRIGRVFGLSGMLLTDETVLARASDLIAGHMGQTAPKTETLLSRAHEGVLFIDEAYALLPGSGKGSGAQYGQEAIAAMVQYMSENAGSIVVVLAGYEDRMQDFLRANEGLSRRFPRKWLLERFTAAGLARMLVARLRGEEGLVVPRSVANFIAAFMRRSWEAAEGVLEGATGKAREDAALLIKAQGGAVENMAAAISRIASRDAAVLATFADGADKLGDTVSISESTVKRGIDQYARDVHDIKKLTWV